MEIVRKPLSALQLDPRNAREHGEGNLSAIEASLGRFQQVEPLIVQRGTNKVIGGNGRLVVMQRLGWTECDVVEVDLDDRAATALGLALNQSASLATWNQDTLAQLLADLQAEGELLGTGFSDSDVDQLLRELELDQLAEIEDPGELEPPAVPTTKLGDLWLLDQHRLLCGDSTRDEDVARLMNGEIAHLLSSDPPYLISYTGENHPAAHHKRAGRTASPGKEVGNKGWDQYHDPEASVEFFAAYLRVALKHCVERVACYQWHASRRVALVEKAWELNGLLVHQTLQWVKTRGVLTYSHFLWRSEPCLYGWVEGKQPDKDRRPPPSETNVWEIGQPDEGGRGIHPTCKPLEVFERPISYHTKPGEICLEPFSGSGSQLIAAHKLNRRCYAMELAPGFVDAAVLRWERATNKQARLEGSGKTFAQVATERSS
jgi:DNA modification methylase